MYQRSSKCGLWVRPNWTLIFVDKVSHPLIYILFAPLHNTTAELSSCPRDGLVHKASYTDDLASHRKSLLTPALYGNIRKNQIPKDKYNDWFKTSTHKNYTHCWEIEELNKWRERDHIHWLEDAILKVFQFSPNWCRDSMQSQIKCIGLFLETDGWFLNLWKIQGAKNSPR